MNAQEVAAFNKGALWACEQMLHRLDVDYRARRKRHWPLDYETLQSVLRAFCHGELNQLSSSRYPR